MLLNCGVGEDSWESLGLQGGPTSPFEGDQPWDFFGRNDVEAETPVLWPPHAKSWFTGKDSDTGRDWGQEEKGRTEDMMAGWHHWLDGRESEWTPGVGDGQGGLACCDSWGHKELDTTERLIWSDILLVFFLLKKELRFQGGKKECLPSPSTVMKRSAYVILVINHHNPMRSILFGMPIIFEHKEHYDLKWNIFPKVWQLGNNGAEIQMQAHLTLTIHALPILSLCDTMDIAVFLKWSFWGLTQPYWSSSVWAILNCEMWV